MNHGLTIALRDLRPDTDYGAIYPLLNNSPYGRRAARSVAPPDVERAVWDDVYALKVVCPRREPARCLGYISLISPDLSSGVGHLNVMINGGTRHPAAGGEAVVLFLRQMFTTGPFRKIMLQTTAQAVPWMRSDDPVRFPGLHLEGILRNQIVVGRHTHDAYIYAFWADEFLRLTDSRARRWSADPNLTAQPSGADVTWADFVEQLHKAFPFLPLERGTSGGMRLDELDIDSLLLIEIVTWIEEHHSVQLDDEALAGVGNLNDLHELVTGERRPQHR